MINFMMKNIWTFLLSLLIVMFVVFLIVYYVDRKYPFETERYMACSKGKQSFASLLNLQTTL